MSEAEVKAFVGERCEEILLEVAEILGGKSPEEVLEAVQSLSINVPGGRVGLSTFTGGRFSSWDPDGRTGADEVPWKKGRRAIASTGLGWYSAIGDTRFDGVPLWRSVQHPTLSAIVGRESTSATRMPAQCPRCFEVSTHADGCMVAANLVRRIKPAWAPWAMWTMPKRLPVGYSLIVVNEACSPRRVTEFADWDHAEGAENDGIAVVCMGFDGLTLEPWETL